MSTYVLKVSLIFMGLLLLTFGLISVIFYDGLAYMVDRWSSEEYSHGYLLPFITGYFIWQKRNELARMPFNSSWVGVVLFCLGLFGFVVGELGTLFTVIQYSFLLTLGGLLLAVMGWPAFRLILAPLFILFFTVPLPNFLYNNLSALLQLISSKIGVDIIRLFGVSVYLEGNVIDLGQFKLQVVEACSGLRYLFPLVSLGYIAAYLYKDSLWKKAVIFLSTIPITVLMNSFRIGVIGVMVEYWGQDMAEGFLHDFEGWFVFMACTAVLLAEMWLLSKIGSNKLSFSEVFAIDPPAPVPEGAVQMKRAIPKTFYLLFTLLVGMAVISQALPERSEIIPERQVFDQFPMDIGEWKGSRGELENIYLEALKLSDYIVANYTGKDNKTVNFYVAYYDSQRKGVSAHSPKSCLPGGGWKIQEFDQLVINGAAVAGKPLLVNRTIIQMGEVKQLVYYWFQQRGRIITNEYLVKWYLFWDALTRQRTDGSLVRITVLVRPGQDVAETDKMLQKFARDVSAELEKFIPE
jgi:exosortase D (VPLPA-CTERM-specific)